MNLLNGHGMDALSKAVIEKEAKRARDAVMLRGRQAVVVIVAADGTQGFRAHAASQLDEMHAEGFAQALIDYAQELRADIARKRYARLGVS